MTAQLPDSLQYNNELYDIASHPANGMFNPSDYGLVLSNISSTTHLKGYRCVYNVRDDFLYLEKLFINLFNRKSSCPIEPGTGPELSGCRPSPGVEFNSFFDQVYNGLDEEVTLTGNLLIAKDFINELHTSFGYPEVWKYEEVIELEFLKGKLVNVSDRSGEMQLYRKKFKSEGGGSETIGPS